MTIRDNVVRRSINVRGLDTPSGQAHIQQVPVYYEEYRTSDQADKTAVIFPFFLGSAHAAGQQSLDAKGQVIETRPGYWDALIGPGAAIDTNEYRVISFEPILNPNFHPGLINPATGKRYASSFPGYKIADYVQLYNRALSALGVDHANLVAGASMGSIQAIQMALSDPDGFDQLLLVVPGSLSLGDKATALVSGWVKQLESDPDWNNGDYDPASPPKAALGDVLTDFWFRAIYPQSGLLGWDPQAIDEFNETISAMMAGSDDELPIKRLGADYVSHLQEELKRNGKLCSAASKAFDGYLKQRAALTAAVDHNILLWQLRSLLDFTVDLAGITYIDAPAVALEGKSMLALVAPMDDVLSADRVDSLELVFRLFGGSARVEAPFGSAAHRVGLNAATSKDAMARQADGLIRGFLRNPGAGKVPAKL